MASAKPKDKGGKPVLDRSKANISDMNMMVLKRIDSHIEEILANAGHVCLYRMSVDDQQWQRKNIEGTLFLIKRRTQPRFQMLVLNKLSTDNYVETVHGGLEMETNPPYLMYTHGNDEIHGIWFYDESDLQRLSSLLQKILNQLPRPDAAAAAAAAAQQQQQQQQQQHQQAPAAVQDHSQPAEPTVASRDGDAFWDKSVHVTEDTLPATQQLVPNSSLLTEPSGGAAAASGGSSAGLQGLLMAAQQKHSAQRTPSLPPSAAAPVPNSTSAPAEPAPVPPAAGLLTPAFFEQQKAKQSAPAPAPASSSSSTATAAPQAPPPPQAAPNGTSNSALHKLLSRAAKQAPGAPAPAPASGAVPVRSQPQPPLGVLSAEAVREKVKAALIRLANNDAFVDILAQEMKTVGLLQ